MRPNKLHISHDQKTIESNNESKIKKINMGEHFRDCFRFTLMIKASKSIIENKMLEKRNKNEKLSNDKIKELCNMLKSRDIFHSK